MVLPWHKRHTDQAPTAPELALPIRRPPRLEDVPLVDFIELRRGDESAAKDLVAAIMEADGWYRLTTQPGLHRIDETTVRHILAAHRLPCMRPSA